MRWWRGITGLVLAVAAAGCGAAGGDEPHGAAAAVTRSATLHPTDELWAIPSPMRPASEYRWADRARFERDLTRHLDDLDRQIDVLRSGLRTGAGPIPSEALARIHGARRRVIVALSELTTAKPAGWERIRLDVARAVAALDSAVLRARRAGTSGGRTAVPI
ncbi:MAG TPA: hypothetical protein VFK09_11015 [Gemmatimonadales bacterium]|nr:hypothetical protein [Gemmatimonadales bacterium]